MNRKIGWFSTLCSTLLAVAIILTVVGCDDSSNVIVPPFRGNPIDQLPADGVLRVSGSPYLAVDTLRVQSGQTLTIESGVELRFEPGMPLEISGRIIARGTEDDPITFMSGRLIPDRGDWDGIWMVDADAGSVFEYCRFWHGAKYGNRQIYRMVNNELDSSVVDYGSITLKNSAPTIKRSWFVNGGFHGVHCDTNSAPIIENNVFMNNAGHGIFVHWTADPTIRNNIIVENDDYGIYCKEDSDAPRMALELQYNIIWSNFSGEFNQQTPNTIGRVVTVNGNLDSCDAQFNLRLNPFFVDVRPDAEVSGDFNLKSTSSAIDAGPEDPMLLDSDGTRMELGIHSYIYRSGEIRRRIPNLPRVTNRLDAVGSPYYMTSDIVLPAGETLTIEEGVEIRVEGLYRMRVQGKIIAHGTAGEPIQFVSGVDNPSRGDWFGLLFESGGDEGTELIYTNVSHAQWGIRLNRRDAMIDNCVISECNSFGIFCDDYAAPSITNSQLINNSQAAVFCKFNSSPDIFDNTISGGDGYGIYVSDHSNPYIRNNLIRDVGTSGIRLENLSSPRIINNTIVHNAYYGVNCDNNSSPIIRNNIFYSNGSPDRGGMGVLARRTSEPEIEYNCFWNHAVTSVDISSDTDLSATNLEQDPLFVDPESDYHLSAGSDCRTEGDPNISVHMGAYGGN